LRSLSNGYFFAVSDDFYLSNCFIVNLERKVHDIESWLVPELHLEYEKEILDL